MIEFALRYARLGWPVLPLNGKLPRVEHGSKDATLDKAQIFAWWKKWPTANIGLATGHKFFAVDVDSKAGGEETWDTLRAQYVALPNTIEQITGTGGKHILFALPADFTVQNSQGKLGPGIDIRGAGGYIVAAPSIHPLTRREYSWDGIEEIENQQIAPAPVWLLALLREDPGKHVSAPPLADKISEGGRNDTLFRSGARLRRFGWAADEIFESLRVINRNRCSPPLPDDEIRTVAYSAARYEPEAKADVFRKTTPGPAGALEEQPEPAELPLGQADVEAAIADAIARNDLLGAMGLAEYVAKLGTAAQVLIETKLRMHFKDAFSSRGFEKILKANGGGSPAKVVQMPAPVKDGTAVNAFGPDLLGYPRTDSGNGERVLLLFGGELRFCIEMQKWLIWDGTRWGLDERALVTQKVKQMARLLHAQAAVIPGDEFKKKMETWARQSESQNAIVAALKRTASEPGIPISAAELDQHPYLLNCLNGVVDLRSGDLVPHDRGYLITKMCHIRYDPDAACPRFLRFLHWAMGDNPDAEPAPGTARLIGFLQRAFGYSLTADVSEKAAFVFWGAKGNNGKTTLLTVFRTLLSEYSAQISIDTLMTTRAQDAGLRADLADLRGARLVTTSEVEKEHRLSEGKLKYITAGMGNIKSCRKYENPIEFPATHKLFMDCNHRPAVRGTDDAIWRRLKPVPFEVSITEEDPQFDKKLAEKMVAEGAGILAWAVRGCRQWMAEGLGEPPEISQANLAWREHDDPLKDFLDDCCAIEVDAWVRIAELSDTYAWWCRKNHERFPLGREQFNERIHSKGYRPSRSRRSADGKQMRTIEGLRVREEIAKQVRDSSGLHRTLLESD